ncbi:MAG: hypothetical protein O3B74_04455 [Proteobacteria bacterium]|nr:hypothetical protein [Pseudomonadota bacterium]MDA1309511.1 hypothetical protein [Pseudomonadota bacterium]
MRLPVIDYDAHPAYAPFAGQVRAERAEVVRAAHADARNLVAERLGGHLLRPSAPDTGLAKTLGEHGVVPFELDAGSNRSLLRYLDERIEQLKSTGEASQQIALAPDRDDGGAGRIGAICVELIRNFDLLAIAKTQLAAETLYVKASLRCSTPDNAAFQRQTITDFPDPATVGLHFDVPTNSIKLTLFVSEVEDLEAGAFGYIPGSHRRDLDDSFDRIATDILCKQDWIDEPIDLMALPNRLRQRATFGGDILPGSEMESTVLSKERIITGPPGRCVLFDTLGVHRGGMVLRGERRALQIGFFDAAWGVEVGATTF